VSFSRYATYRTTEVKHLQEVPEHWAVVPLKRVVKMQSGETISPEMIEEAGPYAVFGGNGTRGFSTEFTHDGEYVLVGRQGALCGNVNYARGQFWASEHAIVVTPYEKTDITWLGECLRAMNLNQYSVSAAQPGLSVDVVSRLAIALPPRDEQIAIGQFLKWEIGKIDALVAQQRWLVELLKEKRHAVISHVVTQGLNPDVPMKPAGIDRLDDVPAHWTVRRMKHVSPQITVGIVVEPSRFYVDSGVPALRSLNIAPGRVLLDNMVFISPDANELHAKSILRAGDLVAVRSGQPGTTAVVPPELGGCNCIDLLIIRTPTVCSGRFLCWYLASEEAVAQFAVGSGGAIQQHFNVGEARNVAVPVPPASEQEAIASFLDSETQRLDALIGDAESAIGLLIERRAALISAAVTGQIDVRGLAISEAS
jgi:type I restriction enzyme, S subunit